MSEYAPAGFDPLWEDLFAGRAWGRYPSEPVIRAIMAAYGSSSDRSTIRVLDLGCGPGANTWFLAREGFTVAGIDGSETAIAQNSARLRLEGLDADLRVGDFTKQIPWEDGSFDAVVDNGSLCANTGSSMTNGVLLAARVLKPGGRLISIGFTDRCWGYGTGRPREDPGAFIDIEVGPLAHKGTMQFLGRIDVERVFAPFAPLSVERSSYTVEQGERLIEMWVVQGRRG